MKNETLTVEQRIGQYLKAANIHQPPDEFVSIVSNIYHAYEAQIYDKRHDEINDSTPYWSKCLQEIAPRLPQKLTVLDVGAGTGFASKQVVNVLGQRIDQLVCQDLSFQMLELCRKELDPSIKASYVSGQLDSLLGKTNHFDLVMTNAVLHHILDLSKFLAVIQKLVKVGGFYIAGHEPSRGFYTENRINKWHKRYRQWRRVGRLFRPDTYLRRLKLTQPPLNIEKLTNEQLVNSGAMAKPFPPGVIPHLVDIHVPPLSNTVPFWGENGFDPHEICAKYLPDFEVFSITTYSHIKDAPSRMGPIWRYIDQQLAKQYPLLGADVLMVFRKIR